MLPAACRMRSSADFTTAIRRGPGVARSARGAIVVHLSQPGRDGGDGVPGSAPRVGLIVSRAVGGAVVRNRVKRRLRHLVRGYLSRLSPGSLLVVRALPDAASASSDRLAADLGVAVSDVIRVSDLTRVGPSQTPSGRGVPR